MVSQSCHCCQAIPTPLEMSESMHRARKSKVFKQTQPLWKRTNPCTGLANQKLPSNPSSYEHEWTPAQGSQIRSPQAILTPMKNQWIPAQGSQIRSLQAIPMPMDISESMRRARKSEAFKQSQRLWKFVNPSAGLANQKLSSNPNTWGFFEFPYKFNGNP